MNFTRVHGRARSLLLAAVLLLGTAPGLANESELELGVGYTADFRRNTTGGLARGNAASGLLELGAVWKTGRLFPGAFVTTSASAIHVGGDALSGDLVGDLQGLNNIEADSGWYLYDLWTEISFGRAQTTTVRTGMLDLNAEFDSSDTAGFFISPPFGIGTDLAQTGENGPAVFPVTSLGLRVGGRLGDAAAWRIAAYDGIPGRTDRRSFVAVDLEKEGGALLIGELEFAPAGVHKIALGAWTYTGRFGRVDAPVSGDAGRYKGNRGGYALVDAPLGAWGATRFDSMLRVGFADGRFNAVDTYVGAGIVASNLLSARPDDAIGLAVAHGRTSKAFRNALAFDGGLPDPAETAVELTWRAPLLSWLAVAPSVQWVDTPGADRQIRSAWVVGLRFEMSRGRSWPLVARRESAPGDAVLADNR